MKISLASSLLLVSSVLKIPYVMVFARPSQIARKLASPLRCVLVTMSLLPVLLLPNAGFLRQAASLWKDQFFAS